MGELSARGMNPAMQAQGGGESPRGGFPPLRRMTDDKGELTSQLSTQDKNNTESQYRNSRLQEMHSEAILSIFCH